jgi:hypothetical protein
VDNPAVAGWRSVAATPLGRLGGGDCGGTKHLQKKIFKKVTTKSNCAKMSTSQTTRETYENEASDSDN